MQKAPIVLLGFGNVAQSLLRLIDDNDGYRREGVEVTLAAVFDRRGGVLGAGQTTKDFVRAKREHGTVTAVASANRVTLEEALDSTGPGGVLVDASVTDARTGEPGLSPSRVALGRGMPVVYASKGPLVVAQEELVGLALEKGVSLGASAAVGIPLPSFEVGLRACRGARVKKLRGILNDTSNQILRDMEAGISLEKSIERARIAGTIEEDPRLDVEGWDAAYKLLILARALWDPSLTLESVDTEGVGEVSAKDLEGARQARKRIRHVATGELGPNGEVRLRTRAEALGSEDPIYSLQPGEKAVVFETDVMGTLTSKTSRGGPSATAACVIKDVLNIVAPPRPF